MPKNLYDHHLSSARKIWADSVKILVIPNPTGYMLTSFGFAFIRLRYILWIPLKRLVNFPKVLNFNWLFFELDRFIYNY